MGSRGARVTYDPFFKFVFNPERNPDRLSELLSLVLGEEVKVIAAIPNESNRITEEGSLLITDILVKLKSGAYANVEIQKVGYAFPGQRCACYSSDLLMRQLTRLKIEAKQNGKPFSYHMIKKVYTIVFMENSTAMYKDFPNVYIHRAKQTFDTGLQMDLLQEYVVIPLDIFRKMHHTELSKLEAWLYLISSDEPQDIYRVMEHYPEFKVIYKELAQLRNNKRELIIMYDSYRQMLAELDRNTTRLMVEELTQEVEELTQKKAELTQEKAELTQEKAELTQEKAELTQEKAELTQEKAELETEIEALKEESSKKDHLIAKQYEIGKELEQCSVIRKLSQTMDAERIAGVMEYDKEFVKHVINVTREHPEYSDEEVLEVIRGMVITD